MLDVVIVGCFAPLLHLCLEMGNDSLMIVAFVAAAVPPKPSANAGAGAALTMTDNQLGIDMWTIMAIHSMC